MPDPLERLRNYGPETGYASPLAKEPTPPARYSPEFIEWYNIKWEGKPNPAMPLDRTDRISNPYRMFPKPPTWDKENPEDPWPYWGGGGAGQGNVGGSINPIYAPQLGREMPAGREGFFDPWDDPSPSDDELGRTLGGKAPIPGDTRYKPSSPPTPTAAEKFIRENSNMINQ